MIIVATFVGNKPSIGYKPGGVYKLKVEGNTIMREDHTGYCPYASLRAFLRNWNSIRVLDGT